MSDPSQDDDRAARLSALEAKIAAAKGETDEKHHSEEHYSQAQIAWRMVTELVAGLGIGFGIGYGLDVLFGTQPWLMLIFTLLGIAAGIQTMMRTAAEINTARPDGAGQAEEDRRDGE